jgi:hypothetical protein
MPLPTTNPLLVGAATRRSNKCLPRLLQLNACRALLAVALLAFGPAANAQAVGNASSVFAGIELSTSQRAAISALGRRTANARQAILHGRKAGSNLSESELNALVKIAQDHNQQVRALLTPEQQSRIDANVSALNAAKARERASQPPTPQVPSANPGGNN